jgi:hypothetical protein
VGGAALLSFSCTEKHAGLSNTIVGLWKFKRDTVDGRIQMWRAPSCTRMRLPFFVPLLSHHLFWMLVEGWECSCIFLVHMVMCSRVIEHCSKLVDVRERKLCMDVDLEGHLKLFA